MIEPAPPSSAAGEHWRVLLVEPGRVATAVYGSRELALLGGRDFAADRPDLTVLIEQLGVPGSRRRISGPSRCAGCSGHVDTTQECQVCAPPGVAP